MLLEHEQICAFTSGAIAILRAGNGWRFVRMAKMKETFAPYGTP